MFATGPGTWTGRWACNCAGPKSFSCAHKLKIRCHKLKFQEKLFHAINLTCQTNQILLVERLKKKGGNSNGY